MWQRGQEREEGRTIVFGQVENLPQSRTTCLVHAFKQVAHKLFLQLQSCTLVRLRVEHVQTLAWACKPVHVEHVGRTCRGHLSMSVAM